jgi:hypothetical protein
MTQIKGLYMIVPSLHLPCYYRTAVCVEVPAPALLRWRYGHIEDGSDADRATRTLGGWRKGAERKSSRLWAVYQSWPVECNTDADPRIIPRRFTGRRTDYMPMGMINQDVMWRPKSRICAF